MTVQQLYNFAQSYNLINENIGIVLDKYIEYTFVYNDTLASNNIDIPNNTLSISNIGSKSNIDYKNKVEYNTEDVLTLFST